MFNNKTYRPLRRYFIRLTIILCFSIALGNSYAQNNGLVAYYPFNGNANDESGNGNDGTVYGATLTEGISSNPNSAYEFDGINDYINISSVSSQLTTTHTRCAWIKTAQYENAGIIGTDNDSDTKGCYLSIDKGKIRFGGRSSYFWNGDSSTIIVADRVWHFVCVVYENGEKATLYIDGQLNKEATVYYSVGDWNTLIGRHPSKYQNYFQGSIDEVRIYNRAISEGEIQDLWKYSTKIKFNINKNYYPYNFKLNQNYPNPFNPITTISYSCLLYTSPSPRDLSTSRMPSSA